MLPFLCNPNILRLQNQHPSRQPRCHKPMAIPHQRRNLKPISKPLLRRRVVPMHGPRAAVEDVEAAAVVVPDQSPATPLLPHRELPPNLLQPNQSLTPPSARLQPRPPSPAKGL